MHLNLELHRQPSRTWRERGLRDDHCPLGCHGSLGGHCPQGAIVHRGPLSTGGHCRFRVIICMGHVEKVYQWSEQLKVITVFHSVFLLLTIAMEAKKKKHNVEYGR